MKKVNQHLLFLIVIVLFISCSNDYNTQNIKTIKYGTSFGMCVGYCKNELIANSDKITYISSGWQENVKEKSSSENMDISIWEEMNTGIDVQSFFELPETIGCPDCADGGSEWLEIELGTGEKHKVVFEYFREPEILKKRIDIYRNLLSKKQEVK